MNMRALRLMPTSQKILEELPIDKTIGGMFGNRFAISQRKTIELRNNVVL